MTDMDKQSPDMDTLEQAAAWFLDLRHLTADAPEHQEHARWLALHPSHRQAWERVQRLQHSFGQLPGAVRSETFQTARGNRRQLLRNLTALLVLGSTVTLGWHQKEALRGLVAHHRTGTGERSHITLDDGSDVQLNTATAFDVHYGADRRELHLYEGEIIVTTATELQQRPFSVRTRHGSVYALGTRFSVFTQVGGTRVQVFEQAVEVRPATHGNTLQLHAGEQSYFSSMAVQKSTPLDMDADAWRNGLLVVDNWPLGRVVHELARYHKGHLGCDPVIAHLTLSGIFHLDDIAGVLQHLTASLPVRIITRFSYWVRVTSA